MTCVHCGESGLTMEYRLRCTPDERAPRDVDLFLCTDCLRTLSAEPDIELIEESPAVAVD